MYLLLTLSLVVMAASPLLAALLGMLVLRESVPVQHDEIVDAAVMSRNALAAFGSLGALAGCGERAGEAQSSDAAVKGIIGLALDEAIHTLYPHLSPAGVASFRQHYADVYVALDQQPSPLFDGVVESLDAFRAQGFKRCQNGIGRCYRR